MTHLLLAIIYLAFISLGLPYSLLGSAWPSMYSEFGVPVSYVGIISMIIAAGTIVSSLQSDSMTRRLGTGKVIVISVAMTAVALHVGSWGNVMFNAAVIWHYCKSYNSCTFAGLSVDCIDINGCNALDVNS